LTSETFLKLKTAQVRPLFKKKNILEKGNYRPVSVLPTISKFVERAIFDQLTDFFNFPFHPSLSEKLIHQLHLLIKNVIGSTIQGIDNFSIFGDIPL
jgi:hypothetical protein